MSGGTANSSNFTTVQGGLSYKATYSGDSNYFGSTGDCEPLTVEKLGAKGCTPGYWKQSQHFDSYVGYSPTDSFETIFGRDAYTGDPSLLAVLNFGGGGLEALGRHTVAALLNSSSPSVNYKYTSSQVISMFQQAFDSHNATTIENTKNLLEAAHSGGCPIS